jgi:hypothetical protein
VKSIAVLPSDDARPAPGSIDPAPKESPPMLGRSSLPTAALLVLGLASALDAAAPDPSTAEVREAVSKALPLIRRGAAGSIEKRECFTCHHQALPVVALSLARRHGFAVEEREIRVQVEHTAADLGGAVAAYRQGRGQGGGVIRAGYALWALEAGGAAPDETTAAVAEFLLLRDGDRDHWRSSSRRPPSEISEFTATALALRGLRSFGTPGQQDRIASRVEAARSWLESTPAQETEDRVFRLWGLTLAGASDATIPAATRELAESQRADGGWAQLADRDSDAYATGSTLVALHLAGGMPTSDPVYRRGLAFLIGNQCDDGSWHVISRSHPFQTYFESGFPHGPDQFISMAASSWSAAALALACPPSE